jgi:hypothetical protein
MANRRAIIDINGQSSEIPDGDGLLIPNLVLEGGFIMPTAIQVNINANTDDLSINGLENGVILLLNTTGNYSLTGIVPPDITEGGLIFLANTGTSTLTLKDNNAGSSANNRFLMGGNRTLRSNKSAIFVYDTINLRYRLFAINI